MASEKTYQVTYKIFGNDKIKKVSFHGKWVYPLYVQLIFDRRNTVYKCNLFDLYLKPKYGIRVAGELFPPPIEEVIKREERLVELIIDKHPDDFSFELFKREYDYYSRDILDEMEPGFMNYLHTFFQDEGLPFLADSLELSDPPCHLAEVVIDMKRALKSDLYTRLVDHSFAYAPPYLPLFQFAQPDQGIRRPLTSMLLMDWEKNETKAEFSNFIKKSYPQANSQEIIAEIEKYVKPQFK